MRFKTANNWLNRLFFKLHLLRDSSDSPSYKIGDLRKLINQQKKGKSSIISDQQLELALAYLQSVSEQTQKPAERELFDDVLRVIVLPYFISHSHERTTKLVDLILEANKAGNGHLSKTFSYIWTVTAPEIVPQHYDIVQSLINSTAQRIQQNDTVTIGFVCTGNANRSALAEILMKDELRKRGFTNVRVQSAGTNAKSNDLAGEPLFRGMREELELGVKNNYIPSVDHDVIELFHSSQLTAEFIRQSDLIFVAEPDHANAVILAALLDSQDNPFSKIVLMTELNKSLYQEYRQRFPDWGSGRHYRTDGRLAEAVHRVINRLVDRGEQAPSVSDTQKLSNVIEGLSKQKILSSSI